jgi:AcrR family transcriptional regulator
MELYVERGFDQTTVADIAERAGLTKRSFFNHFADKREVMFASADALQASILAALAEAGTDLDPLDAAVWAFTQAAAAIADYPDLARARRALIASSSDLQERDLMKMASMTAAVADALVRRGVPRRDAIFVSQAATTVFATAVDEWAGEPERGLAASIRGALTDLRAALGSGDRLRAT